MAIHTTTRDKILDVTQSLIQKRGYSAISFNHIAEQVGIKKPSIVHHFPDKASLAASVVSRYRKHFGASMDSAANDQSKTCMQTLDLYCMPYTDFGKTNDMICLCGALAGEFTALPSAVQEEITLFFNEHLKWLEILLRRGLKSGEFNFAEKPSDVAQLILDSLQGALIVKRAMGNGDHVKSVINMLKSKLEN